MSGMSALGGMPQGMSRQFQPPSFSSLDSNSDGGITLDELTSNAPGGASDAQSSERAQELFSKMDADGDGVVTSDEKDTFDSEMQDKLSQMQFSAQLMASAGPPPAQGSGESSAASTIVDQLDSDSDGSISLDELSSSDAAEGLDSDELQSLFESMDSDGSGSVSTDELSSFLADNKPAGPAAGAGGPPPPPPPSASASDSDSEDDDSSTASVSLSALTAALSAYQSSGSTSSQDLASTLLSALDEAA